VSQLTPVRSHDQFILLGLSVLTCKVGLRSKAHPLGVVDCGTSGDKPLEPSNLSLPSS
jgi:hypothetical protein